jgi:hypothetical protein
MSEKPWIKISLKQGYTVTLNQPEGIILPNDLPELFRFYLYDRKAKAEDVQCYTYKGDFTSDRILDIFFNAIVHCVSCNEKHIEYEDITDGIYYGAEKFIKKNGIPELIDENYLTAMTEYILDCVVK